MGEKAGREKRATAGVTEGEAGKGVEAVSGSHVGEMSTVFGSAREEGRHRDVVVQGEKTDSGGDVKTL